MSTRCTIHSGDSLHIYYEMVDGLYHCEIGQGSSFINFIMDKYIAMILVRETGGIWTDEFEDSGNVTKSK